MPKNKLFFNLCLTLSLLLIALSCTARSVNASGNMGQAIQINTQLHSFVGRPSWLLIVRDVDSGESFQYLYDMERGNNFWLALTYGRNYLITASSMQFAPYSRFPFRKKS